MKIFLCFLSLEPEFQGIILLVFAAVGVLSVGVVLCSTSASVLPAQDVGSQPGAPTD